MGRGAVPALALALLACASGPPRPGPGEAAIWGEVHLVPPAGVPTGTGSAYGDRRLADVRLVDYSRVGFVVLYAEPGPPRVPLARVRVTDGRVGPRLEPAHAALGVGGEVEVRNASRGPAVLSCPRAGILVTLTPGETLTFPAQEPGEHDVHLLGARPDRATLFAAPGPHTVADSAGRFALEGLAPGRHTLRAWHPRFPPVALELDLAPGEARRVVVEVGAGLGEGRREEP